MVSRITLAVAASMLLGAAMTPVQAADLKGGGCCADLEERVAELEATTARKGNRVVSLQIYGDITQGLLIWDNGEESDAFVTDNDALGSVLGFKGEAQLKPGVKVGYKMEMQVQSASSSAVSEQGSIDGEDLPGDDPADNLSIRHNHLYIESERWGRITIGQASTAADGAAQVNLANTLMAASPDQGTALHPGGLSAGGLTLGEYASDLDGGRNDIIRYDTPTIAGFVASASWGDDDYWDIALRFSKEFNSIKFAAAVAYSDDQQDIDAEFTQIIGSASVMHVPTGLFVSAAAGEREFDDSDVTASFWHVQAGIERKFLPYGTTTFYGEYGEFDDIVISGTEAEVIGVGIVQKIDSAAMDFYAQARFWTVDDETAPDADELSTIMLGSRIQF